jgi:hypothetical protein
MFDLIVRRGVCRLVASIALIALSASQAHAYPPGFVYALEQARGAPQQIFGFRLDPVTGALTPLPGFPVDSGGTGAGAAISEQLVYARGRLYVINDGSDTLSVFAVNQATGALTALPFSPIGLGAGDWWCAAVHPGGSPVVVADTTGHVASFNVTATTASAAAGSPYTTIGVSSSSCHFSRDGNYVYTGGNFGTAVAGFSAANTGVLTPLPGSPFDFGVLYPGGYATDGAGRLFAANFLARRVTAFTIASGVPTGVTGNPFPSGLSQAVHAVLHPAGFYMVADFTGDRVGVYGISGSGAATALTEVSGSPFATAGHGTEVLALTHDGGLLVAANGFSHNLTVFGVNGKTGGLTTLGVQPVNTLGTTELISGLVVTQPTTAKGDFDGDLSSDITVFRPSTGGWYVRKSIGEFTSSTAYNWGLSTDTIVPGDYDGDGKVDPAVFRASTGGWYVLKSSTNYTTSSGVSWGVSTDVPVPGDYDGDGRTDPAVFRPSNGSWYYLKSSTNYTTSVGVSWGLSTDVPVQGDYDGDGKTDPAVFRPSTGGWHFLKSTTSYASSGGLLDWGLPTDLPVPGDYDGDGKADPTVFENGIWITAFSRTGYTTSSGVSWGLNTDVPVPADYDGDGKVDPAIFRASTGLWAILKSSTNYTSAWVYSWGLSTDKPVNTKP